MLRVAAETFEITPEVSSEGHSLTGSRVGQVFTPLKSSVVLIEHDGFLVALLTSHLTTHYYPYSNLLRSAVAKVLHIPREQVLCFSSHNHCSAQLFHTDLDFGVVAPEAFANEKQLTREGRLLREAFATTAMRLSADLREVELRYGVGHERRISHNRKGRRADGSTFFMREQDRLLYGDDYRGDIDDDAFVVGFFDRIGKPVAFLTQFTAHPVTAFHCEQPVVHGEFPQVACDDLSDAWGGVPVAFLQGCAGDVNSKGLLSDTPAETNVQNAERYGHCLGETFIEISRSLTSSKSNAIRLDWYDTTLPFAGLPSQTELAERLRQARRFLQLCDEGNESETRWCDGLNFPGNMSVKYRRALIQPIENWLEWALDFHKRGALDEAPRETSLLVAALRLGDVGIIGMPCEPLLGVGRQIKKLSSMPLTIPCGYMNDSNVAYIPDAPNSNDLDYVSGFYRYTRCMLPFRRPAGDLLADAAAQMLRRLSQ